jgi:TRAP-type C4-dicarboxylate transport system permease small subunit
MKIFLVAVLICIICILLAFVGVLIIKSNTAGTPTVTFAIIYAALMLGCGGLIVRSMYKEKRIQDIRSGKRPIE